MGILDLLVTANFNAKLYRIGGQYGQMIDDVINDWIYLEPLVNDCIYYQRLTLDGCGPLWTTSKPGQFGKKLTGFE